MSRPKRQRLDKYGRDKIITSQYSEVANEETVNLPHAHPQGTQNARSLFVRSLPATVTSESLANFFSQSHPIKHATVVLDKATKQSKGFGFVTFADTGDANAAQKTFDGARLDGRHIRVDIAQPRARAFSIVQCPSNHSHSGHVDREREQPQNKIIVRNMPWTIKTEEQLADVFKGLGKIQHVNLPKTKPGLSPGFGFIVFRQHEAAKKALDRMNGKDIDGRTIAVDWAVDKSIWENIQQHETLSSESQENHSTIESDEGTSDIASTDMYETGSEENTNGLQSSNDGGAGHDEFKQEPASRSENYASTIFVSNVPFTATNESIHDHFSVFGHLKSARVVQDSTNGTSKGTAFVCFRQAEDASACLRQAAPVTSSIAKQPPGLVTVLEDRSIDPTGRFTLDGRIMKVFQAVNRDEATRLAVKNTQPRDAVDGDKRRLYLLAEGAIPPTHSLYKSLSPSEAKIRADSIRQRRALVRKDPSLNLSLTRLSIRNLPKGFTSKSLKALAREGVLGFAKEVKAGLRKPLSKDESTRGGQELRSAEKKRKAKGKGIVKQTKIIFEGRDGTKVAESSGAGRSRGYGFIEYTSHRWALMGLRWLNGHLVESSNIEHTNATTATAGPRMHKRRLLVEFAIDNAQVVARRQQRETRASLVPEVKQRQLPRADEAIKIPLKVKRKSESNLKADNRVQKMEMPREKDGNRWPEEGSKEAKKQYVIGRKRMARKVRRKT